MHCADNPIVYALTGLHQNRFIAIGCKYGICQTVMYVLKKLCGEYLLEL